MGKLDGRVAIVAGAGQQDGSTLGNGRAIAQLFAKQGASVFAVDRDAAKAESTVEAIRRAGGSADACTADVTSDDDCARLARACTETFERVDILVNNVGIGAVGGPVELEEEDWRRVLDTNLTSMFLTCKHVLPSMEGGRGGSVVNISSLAAVRHPAFPMAAYSASKGGVNAFSRSLAMQYASRGIRVNVVMPGLIETPMAMEGLAASLGLPLDRLRAARNAAVPMGHMGQADDVAQAALFLASDDARYITGVVLAVDGGLSLKG